MLKFLAIGLTLLLVAAKLFAGYEIGWLLAFLPVLIYLASWLIVICILFAFTTLNLRKF